MVSLGSGWMFLALMVLVIVGVIGIIKKNHAISTGVMTLLSVLFIVTVGYVYITKDISLTSLDGLIEGARIYFSWLISAAKNMIDITSYAIRLDWIPR